MTFTTIRTTLVLTFSAASLAALTGDLRVRSDVEKRAVAAGTAKRVVVARGVLAVLSRNDIAYRLTKTVVAERIQA